MAANAEIFFEHDRWGPALTWSVGLHLAIVAGPPGFSSVFFWTQRSGMGCRWRRRGHGSHAGEHRAPAGQCQADGKYSGKRIERDHKVPAQARTKRAGRD